MREIITGKLWIGNARDARDVKNVLSLPIAAVIDLALDEAPIVYPRDIVYCRFPMLDGAGNSQVVLEAAIGSACAFIKARKSLLVACSGGMSRSPAITAAALALATETDLPQALTRVLAGGPRDLNAGLWKEVTLVHAKLLGDGNDTT